MRGTEERKEVYLETTSNLLYMFEKQHSYVDKKINLQARLPGFKYQLCHHPAPQFPHLKSRNNNNTNHTGCEE